MHRTGLAALLLCGTGLATTAATADLRNNEYGGVASLSSLSVTAVQNLLEDHDLAPFLGEDFAQYRIDGPTLSVMQREHVSPADFPNAKPFHWAKFWAIVDGLKAQDQDQDQGLRDVVAKVNGDSEATVREGRDRRLASSTSGASGGIKIRRPNATIWLGPDDDTAIRRSAAGELTVHGRLLVQSNSTTDYMDVGATLDALLDGMAAAEGLPDKVDLLADMVALNTELLINSSAMLGYNAELLANVTDCSDSSDDSTTQPTKLYSCMDVNLFDGDSGVYETVDFGDVVCNEDLSVGGWSLAMNIDTSGSFVCVLARSFGRLPTCRCVSRRVVPSLARARCCLCSNSSSVIAALL